MNVNYNIRAYYVSRGLDLAKIEKKILKENVWKPLRKTRLYSIYEIEENRFLHLYFFGVLVFINFEDRIEKKIIKSLAKFFIKTLKEEEIEIEEYSILEDETIEKDLVEFEQVKVKKLDLDRQEIIASILAQSIAIDYFEKLTNGIALRFDEINVNLEKNGSLRIGSRQVLKLIGSNNAILNFILSKLSLLDKPDILWEKGELESLFQNLRLMFELDNRFRNLEIKTN